jgi:hypothetical protein
MADANFTELWRAVDDSLDKITCLLKGAVCIYENCDEEEDVALSLVYVALERATAFERQLRVLNDQYLDLEKETGKFEGTPIETEQPA